MKEFEYAQCPNCGWCHPLDPGRVCSACPSCQALEQELNYLKLDEDGQMTYRASAKDRAKTSVVQIVPNQNQVLNVPAGPAVVFDPGHEALKKKIEETLHAIAEGVGTSESRFPHTCPKCGSPAYVGFSRTECSNGGCK